MNTATRKRSYRMTARAQSDITAGHGLDLSAGAEFERERTTSTYITDNSGAGLQNSDAGEVFIFTDPNYPGLSGHYPPALNTGTLNSFARLWARSGIMSQVLTSSTYGDSARLGRYLPDTLPQAKP